MGKLEHASKSHRRKDYVQKAVLSTLAMAGILAVTAVAPNMLQLLGKGRKLSRFSFQTKSVLSRLAQKGLVRFVDKNGNKSVELTPDGQRAVELEVQKNALSGKRPKRWDHRWRLVMFDIPEKRKGTRDLLRRTMMDAGFVLFQDSVWIYPFDCEELIILLKIEMRLGNSVRYAIVEQLENDSAFREKFGIKT